MRTLTSTCALGLVLLLATAAAAQTPVPASADAATTAASHARWHLYGGLGYGGAGGGYGEFLKEPIQWELRIAKSYGNGAWRFGGGLQFGSMAPDSNPGIPPDVLNDWLNDKEWAHLETFGTVTRVFNPQGSFRPYLQGRVGLVRIHPRSELFYNKEVPPEGLEPGESPTLATNGIGFTVQPGFELYLGRTISLDVGAFWTWYHTKEYDLSPIGLEPVSNGQEYGVRVGLAWQPFIASPPISPKLPVDVDSATGKPRPLPPPDDARDAWGVRRSWGWATAEMLAINFGASMMNEYVRDANFNQISPRSFWHNFEEGFTWDDNEFKTNQLLHPFNGATYFNSARANGVGFWGSSAMAITGAFVWECCGETHPMSFNDMMSTGIGGIARGEVSYRISSAILDNTSRGMSRFGREAAALLVDPVHEFNRLVRGDATRYEGNPADPYDWRPPNMNVNLRVGGRVIGQGESITENTNYYGFAEVTVAYGSPWDNERRRPYDRFDVVAGMNFGDKTRLGKLLIRGDLFSFPLGDGHRHTLAIQQDFDYIDNEAYEYGGQSLGAALQSRFHPFKNYQLWSRLQGYAILLGAVNSDYAFLADVADRERYREYDYGPGVGASWELYLLRKGRSFLSLRYRFSYINVKNGSVYNDTSQNLGLNADHDIHQLKATLDVPVTHRIALGADGSIFFRRSNYDLTGTGETGIATGKRVITQRNPEIRAYVAWQW
jgi:hypothetical protein